MKKLQVRRGDVIHIPWDVCAAFVVVNGDLLLSVDSRSEAGITTSLSPWGGIHFPETSCPDNTDPTHDWAERGWFDSDDVEFVE